MLAITSKLKLTELVIFVFGLVLFVSKVSAYDLDSVQGQNPKYDGEDVRQNIFELNN